MMRGFRSLFLLMVPILGGTFLTGCAPEATKSAPVTVAPMIVPASSEQIGDVRATITRVNPNARVGQVSSVRADSSLAAVSGISVSEVPPGASIQFVDSRGTPIANGTVRPMADKDTVYVIADYEPIKAGRAPMVGDLAVYIPR